MRRPYASSGEIAPKERVLRGAIVAASIFALPIPPSAVFGIHAALVTFCLLAGIPATFVLTFYVFWTLGVFLDGVGSQLIGDDSFRVPRLYWPWGPYQRHLRHRRRVRAMEIACEIPTRDYWHADE